MASKIEARSVPGRLGGASLSAKTVKSNEKVRSKSLRGLRKNLSQRERGHFERARASASGQGAREARSLSGDLRYFRDGFWRPCRGSQAFLNVFGHVRLRFKSFRCIWMHFGAFEGVWKPPEIFRFFRFFLLTLIFVGRFEASQGPVARSAPVFE